MSSRSVSYVLDTMCYDCYCVHYEHSLPPHREDSDMSYVQRVQNALLAELPTLDRELLRLYALLVLVWGEDTTLADVHDAWAVWRTDTRPDHPSLVPFDELAPEVQELDRPYMDAIHRVARTVAVAA